MCIRDRYKPEAEHRCALIYPDVYEVGLPNQGIAILYRNLNEAEGLSCERGYIPWVDMADEMRAAGIPLLCLLYTSQPGTTRWRASRRPPG